MNPRRLLLICSLWLAVSSSAWAAAEDAFAKANQEYAAGNFAAARDLYESQGREGAASAALFYNLGNAHFRAGDAGRAILNYQRALALEPHHPEAEANLRLVRDKARALELRKTAVQKITTRATPAQYSVVAAGSFWVAAFLLAGLFFTRRRSALQTALLVISVVSLLASVGGLHAFETGPHGRDLAIVIAKETEARLATADNAGTVLTLPPGSEIRILSTRGDWTYAVLPNDLRGWIPAPNAERVRR